MVSVLHNELEYKVEKLKYKKLEIMQPRIKNKAELPVGEVNHPRSVHTKFYSRDWFIQSIIYDRRIITVGEGGRGLKERRGLTSFLPPKKGAY